MWDLSERKKREGKRLITMGIEPVHGSGLRRFGENCSRFKGRDER